MRNLKLCEFLIKFAESMLRVTINAGIIQSPQRRREREGQRAGQNDRSHYYEIRDQSIVLANRSWSSRLSMSIL